MKDLQSNPCAACPGHCCSRNVINVCGYDAWSIAHALGIAPTDFLAFARLEEETPYNFRLDGSGASYHLALNMNLHADDSRRCVFGLNFPRGQFRCGIYALRPIGCRSYPFAFGEDGPALKPWALCPEKTWDFDHLSLASLGEQLAQSDMEFCIYALAVAVWNESMADRPPLEKLDFRPFVNFVMDIYDRLAGARAEIPPETWPKIWNRWRGYIANGVNPLELNPTQPSGPPAWRLWIESIHQAAGAPRVNDFPEPNPV